MKYEVGDKVMVRNDLEDNTRYGEYNFVKEMNRLKNKIVTIDKVVENFCYYTIKEDCFRWTDEMFEPVKEMSAKDALKAYGDMCRENSSCSVCPIGKEKTQYVDCLTYFSDHTDKVLKALTQWKTEHEKKPIETELVHVIRVFEVDGQNKKCIYEERFQDYISDLSEKQSDILKKYCKDHDGNFYSTIETICVVKE